MTARVDPTDAPQRRRRARRVEHTSDVTRFRGVLAGALAAALIAALATVALSSGDARRGSPGPLARPHAIAGVTCAACHDPPSFAAACTGCHGAHPSARAAHRALARDGALGCADCHPGHGGGGATLAGDGRALRYGAGAEQPAPATRFRAVAPVSVPLVAAAACARCHRLGSPRDPASACVIAGQDALGGARPTVCFDEHRPIRDGGGAIAARAAAWEAAREVAAAAPATPAAPAPRHGPWPWLGLGLAAAGLVWSGARLRDRRARRAPAAAASAASAVPAPAAVAADPAAPASPARTRLPVIDSATCLGCYACVDACPYDVLEIRRYVAVVARPADCCGLILCEQKCPNGSLAIGFVDRPDQPALELRSSEDQDGRARAKLELADTLESRRVPGLFIAGDAGGQPLIRNAINQGADAVRAIAARPRARAGLDLLIVGAGPAGLAAALEARARGLRYLALEQATIADGIRSFPRGKLVIDPDLPNRSALWLAEATKEELLARWTRTVREARPAIAEGRRVTRIARGDAGFVVDDVDRDGATSSHAAAHVVIAIGRRGTPRRLAAEVPPDWADHVHYSLADARSFAGRRVLVVGLGDVAMEAAIALSRQPATEVVVSARAGEFRRGKARNIAELRRRIASGALRIVWHSEVAALAPARATLATPSGRVDVACDAVLVLIGSIPAEDLLRGCGVLT